MTELERILTNSLTTMERELTASRETHKQTLDAHSQAIQHLQAQVNRIQAEQQESARHLEHLGDVHANLSPLVSRLRAVVSGK